MDVEIFKFRNEKVADSKISGFVRRGPSKMETILLAPKFSVIAFKLTKKKCEEG